jgi:hypothetical protein
MVEGRQEVYKLEKWLVWDSQLEKDIHLLDGSHLSTVWREGLLQVFGRMDSLGIHSSDLQKNLQLGSNNFQEIEHLCTAGLDFERRGSIYFPHGLVLARCYLCEKCLWRNEFKMAFCRAPGSCLLQHTMGEQVENSYALICDEFITRIYFIIFKKVCLRLSAGAKKMVENVGR